MCIWCTNCLGTVIQNPYTASHQSSYLVIFWNYLVLIRLWYILHNLLCYYLFFLIWIIAKSPHMWVGIAQHLIYKMIEVINYVIIHIQICFDHWIGDAAMTCFLRWTLQMHVSFYWIELHQILYFKFLTKNTYACSTLT